MSNIGRPLDVLLACHMGTRWVVCVDERPGEALKVLQKCEEMATGARYKLCIKVPSVLAPNLAKLSFPKGVPVYVVWKGNDFENPVRIDVGVKPSDPEPSYEAFMRVIKYESVTVTRQKAYLERRSDVLRRTGNEAHPGGFLDPVDWDTPTDALSSVNQITLQHDWEDSGKWTTSTARHTNLSGTWLMPAEKVKKAVEAWSKEIRPATDLGLPVEEPLLFEMDDLEPWTGPAVPESPMAYDEETMHYIDPTHPDHARLNRERNHPSDPWHLGLTENVSEPISDLL